MVNLHPYASSCETFRQTVPVRIGMYVCYKPGFTKYVKEQSVQSKNREIALHTGTTASVLPLKQRTNSRRLVFSG